MQMGRGGRCAVFFYDYVVVEAFRAVTTANFVGVLSLSHIIFLAHVSAKYTGCHTRYLCPGAGRSVLPSCPLSSSCGKNQNFNFDVRCGGTILNVKTTNNMERGKRAERILCCPSPHTRRAVTLMSCMYLYSSSCQLMSQRE